MRDVLGAIVESVATVGYPPTVRELAARFGVGVATIQRDLDRLEDDGRIRREGARAIRILDKGNDE